MERIRELNNPRPTIHCDHCKGMATHVREAYDTFVSDRIDLEVCGAPLGTVCETRKRTIAWLCPAHAEWSERTGMFLGRMNAPAA